MTRKASGKQTRNNGAFATVDDIRRLLGEPVEVEAAGLRLRLEPPSAASALAVREKLFAALNDDEQKGGVLLRAASAALQACFPAEEKVGSAALGGDEAARLILRAGGESGALARTALKLCGLDTMLGAAGEASGAEDPTPFGSPAPADNP